MSSVRDIKYLKKHFSKPDFYNLKIDSVSVYSGTYIMFLTLEKTM